MAVNTVTSENKVIIPGGAGGVVLGEDASALVGFYGTTPAAQPSGAAQAAVTDSSGGTANSATGIATLTGTYNSTIIANAIATLAAQTNAIRSALVTVGIMKGSA